MAVVASRSFALRNQYLKHLICSIRTISFAESGDVVFPEPPPFDYIGRPFTILRSLRDPTYARLNENSRVIAVEGNIGSGKSFLASKLAEYFGMNYFPDPTEDDIYIFNRHKPPFDLRCHNALLPPSAMYYTCKMFWNEPDLIHKGKPLYLQYQFYIRRYWNYLKALCTLLNTGRGFVVERSPFSELAFSDALFKCGYLSDRGHRWFNQNHAITVGHLWKPHILIYVKVGNQQIREHFKKRNISWEVNGRNLTDYFLDAYCEALEKYLSGMRRYCEILVVDGSTTNVYSEDDARVIAQKITEMNITGDHLLRDDYKLLQWRQGFFNDRSKINARANFSNAGRSFTSVMRRITSPYDLNELRYSHADRELQSAALRLDPRTAVPPTFNQKQNSLFDVLFNPFTLKKNYAADLPKDYLWP